MTTPAIDPAKVEAVRWCALCTCRMCPPERSVCYHCIPEREGETIAANVQAELVKARRRIEVLEGALSGLVGRYMIDGVKGTPLWEAARAALAPTQESEATT